MPRGKKADHELTFLQSAKYYLEKLEGEISTLTAKASELKRLVFGGNAKKKVGGDSVGISSKTAKKVKGKKKRVRRSPEQLKKHADDIVAAIKAKGEEGASAKDLAKFNYGISLKNFMTEQGHKVKSKGKTAKTRYFVA